MIIVDRWPGLVTNASPYAIKPGAAVQQVNLQIISPGQIAVRPGTAAVSFSLHSGSTAGIWSAFRYPGSYESVIYQSVDGAVRIALEPAG